jgi:predicted amidohydrolase YtcJ
VNSDKKPAEIIICNAKVLTIDSQFSKAEALAISGGRILAVGTNHQIEAFNGSAIDAAKLDEMTHGTDGKGDYGPTGAGDNWVRIGPFKVLLDGGILIDTAYTRDPWGCGPTWDYSGRKFIFTPAPFGLVKLSSKLGPAVSGGAISVGFAASGSSAERSAPSTNCAQ